MSNYSENKQIKQKFLAFIPVNKYIYIMTKDMQNNLL